MKKIILLLILCAISLPSQSLEALIEGSWLKSNLNSDKLFVLDIQDPPHYQRYHVPGAVNAPYGVWRTGRKSPRAGMRPPTQQLEELLGKLGIKNDSQIVIVATGLGAGDMAAAGRVFWTLKTLGHKEVGILNGGLATYANDYKGPLEAKPNQPHTSNYKAQEDLTLIADASQIQQGLKSGTPLLDARSQGEYMGVTKASPKDRAGTIPGAKHLPFDWLVDLTGKIRNHKDLLTLIKSADLSPEQANTIHFCHSGNRASLNWFVDYAVLGHTKAKLYDASIGEWAPDPANPMERKIELSD